MNREQLIEKAAKALFEARFAEDRALGVEIPAWEDEPVGIRDGWIGQARAALVVFEEANTPTSDELRDAIDHVQGAMGFQDAINPESIRVLISAAGFHRTVQGEHQKEAIYGGEEHVCVTCPRNSYGEHVAWDQAHPDPVQGEPSDATFGIMAQRFYEASGLNIPHTSKPEVVAGLRAALRAAAATEGGGAPNAQARIDEHMQKVAHRVMDVFEDADEDTLADEIMQDVFEAIGLAQAFGADAERGNR